MAAGGALLGRITHCCCTVPYCCVRLHYYTYYTTTPPHHHTTTGAEHNNTSSSSTPPAPHVTPLHGMAAVTRERSTRTTHPCTMDSSRLM